ncbi:Kunitz/Bovine pancreatic trypsin inhibitor domain protein [Cooperia oncophora]
MFHHFYYDFNEGVCKEFIYGGCGGNANRFETASECAVRCSRLHQPRRESSYAHPTVEALQYVAPEDIPFEQSVPEQTSQENYGDRVADEVLQRMDYDEKKVLAIGKVSLSPYGLPELCSLPEEHGSCYDDILRWRSAKSFILKEKAV